MRNWPKPTDITKEKKTAKSGTGMQQTQSIKEFENLKRNSFERVTLTAQ
jgi:hypothetical protein